VARVSTEARGTHFTDPGLLARVDAAGVVVPRGEPCRLAAELARALLARAPEAELNETLASAAEALWDDDARERVARAAGAARVEAELDAPARENAIAHALAYAAALPLLAREEAVRTPLAELEPYLAQLDEEDRAAFAPALARTAVPALGVDLELLADEGYRYVATYPPEGSEGVDIVGRAASWLTRRMTVDGDAPRLAMRRFLAVLAEEVELELPLAAAALDGLLAEPMPELAKNDRPFLALARGLVDEAIAERGFPF
jgi:hypothetical protein